MRDHKLVQPVDAIFSEAFWRELARPGADPLSAIGPLFQFAAAEHPGPAPALGQHTRAILLQIGLTEAELQNLEADGVAKSAD